MRLLKPEHLNTGLELIRRIQERLLAILQHSTQVGAAEQSQTSPVQGNQYRKQLMNQAEIGSCDQEASIPLTASLR